MDWDGIGTFALFISSGALGVGIIALKAYKARLASKLEWARLERSTDVGDETAERLHHLEDQLRNLHGRLDFTEKLLSDGDSSPRSPAERV